MTTSRRHPPYTGPALFHLRALPDVNDLRRDPHIASIAARTISADIAAIAIAAIYGHTTSSPNDSDERRAALSLLSLVRAIDVASEEFRRALSAASEDDIGSNQAACSSSP